MKRLTASEFEELNWRSQNAATPQERWGCTLALDRFSWSHTIETGRPIFQVENCLRLIWDSKAIYHPEQAIVRMSPYEYLLTLRGQRLLRPIQRAIAWNHQKFVLFEDWPAARETLVQQSLWSRWRSQYLSARGATLSNLWHPVVTSTWSLLAIRTAHGLWWQSFQDAWPAQPPCLDTENKEISLVVFAHLDPQWYRRLPFEQHDLTALEGFPNTKLLWSERSLFSEKHVPPDEHLKALLAIQSAEP